jgi:hypothetical protein
MEHPIMLNLFRSVPVRAMGTVLGVLVGASATLEAAPPRAAAMRAMPMAAPMATRAPFFRMFPPTTTGISVLPNSQMLINPAFQIAPGLSLNQFAFNNRVLAHTLRQYPPYAFGYNPYGSAMGYGGMGYGGMGYGGMGYGGMGYGGSSPAMMYSGAYSGGYDAPSAIPAANLAANAKPPAGGNGDAYGRIEGKSAKAGVFAGLLKDDGRVDWPVALRILPPGLETKALRESLDARVAQLQTQGGDGKADAGLVKEAKGDLNKLDELLADRDGLLPVTQDAMGQAKDFVRKLRSALKALE